MEISEDSENETSPASQARPPANTTRARAPRRHAPASGARARAHSPAVPAAPHAPTAPTAPTPTAHAAHAFPVAPAAPGAGSNSNLVHSSSFKPIHRLKLSLPRMRRADERFLLPESSYNMIVNGTIYTSLKTFLVSVGETEDATFPWWRVIQDFVHLYFEHFDHEYPVVHPYALEFGLDKTSTSWMVLLAVVTVGSQYSAFSNASLFSAAFGEILSHAITQNRPQAPEATTLSYAQSVFLSDVCLMFDGSHKAQLKLQYERNALVTLARVLKVDPCMNTKASQAPRHWKAWLARESRIRLLHCIFRMYPYDKPRERD
ncbi:transcriptional regulator family: C2H2 zinc finger and Fungal Specific TF [Penicillium concentricum]|uniref:Transcriptional regulator family: C2H2 zinc finger and Fungal Specific TF n=1 Tax=Penicillium concentricum TaxID=293559 RepID=A0A9W9RHB8_9EURO|nr:transcriptional regulator family: C2H2 zinc finger and Fungal Specific TF [Penicillium concentricum]KAJ5360288.1 transcriptional regulator family: C2H2 zinc finger and Fungal Specific TF [Penicillium concentricum]